MAAGVTSTRLAAEAGVSSSRMIESGTRWPTARVVVALAKALGVDPGHLLFGQAAAPRKIQRSPRRDRS